MSSYINIKNQSLQFLEFNYIRYYKNKVYKI